MFRHAFKFVARARGLSQKAACAGIAVVALALCSNAPAQSVPTPKSVLGFEPTTERTVADWTQILTYFKKLDDASDRVSVREIGPSTLGQPMVAAFISDPSNIRKLEDYRRISAKLADPRTVKDTSELEDLIKKGKTIVSISCSIHSTEIVASQMSMHLAYELATAKDDATKEILKNTILILIPSSNPDGINTVANWYRKTLGTKSEGTTPPEVYHPYAGHDNNRDWFMLNLAESRNITRLYWQQWFPQIVYDVHQMGQTGARMIAPPFFDPPNPRIDPLLLREVGLVGYKMASDLQMKGHEGIATNSTFDTWWHGGFRTAPYYHNSIGILTEAASADLMTPVTITKEQLKANRGSRGLNSPLETQTSHPDAWEGGKWGPTDIAAMEMTTSRALLELASKFRTRYLRNFYELGAKNLERTNGEPAAFIIPAGQPNAEVMARFIEILTFQGVEVHRMTEEGHFATDASGARYEESPLGSFIVYVNQPQKNNVLSLFEKQIYPNRLNAAGEAEVPYDVAGWTLPLQMGIETFPIYNIKDENKFRGTLSRILNINEARKVLNLPATSQEFAKLSNPINTRVRIGLYRGFTGSMDEGWTRLVLDTHQVPYKTVTDADVRSGKMDVDALILPSDGESSIVDGLNKERYPEELTGGIGTAGVDNLKRWVEGGGTLICFDDSCELVIKKFNLPIKNVLSGLKRSEFYNPGSVVSLTVEKNHPLAKNIGSEVAAYFINSSAFEITDTTRVASVATYASRNALLSGWMLGEKHVNGKTALAEALFGKGRITLFAFRPQHRGQTFATFPFIFNAIQR